MFRIRDPRAIFKFVAIYSYIMLGMHVLNIINDVRLQESTWLALDIAQAVVAFVCGMIFYLYSMMNLMTVIKYKKLLWIPAIAMLLSDIFVAIIAMYSIVRFNGFVKILNMRQQARGNAEYDVSGSRRVINVDCTVVDSADSTAFNEKLARLDTLKASGDIDEYEYKNLKSRLIDEYLK